jgi:hypothetical protein
VLRHFVSFSFVVSAKSETHPETKKDAAATNQAQGCQIFHGTTYQKLEKITK